MDWFRRLKMKEHKKRALLEVRTDMRFIAQYRNDWLNFDESLARKELTKLKTEKESDKTLERLAKVSKEIALSQATKKEYEDLKKLETDLSAYIRMI